MAEQKQPYPTPPSYNDAVPQPPGGPSPIPYPGQPPMPYPGQPPMPYPGPPPMPHTGPHPPPEAGVQYQFSQPVMAPGQPGYVAGQPIAVQPMPGQHIIIQQSFRESPVNCVCNFCGQNIITTTRTEAGGLAWLLCFLLVLFGLWLGCCLIPFCIPGCHDVKHSCPNCKKTLYVYRRI